MISVLLYTVSFSCINYQYQHSNPIHYGKNVRFLPTKFIHLYLISKTTFSCLYPWLLMADRDDLTLILNGQI